MPYLERMPSPHTLLYCYRVNDKIVGPISLTDLHTLLTSKKISSETMIRKEGSSEWRPLMAVLRHQERLLRLKTAAEQAGSHPPKTRLLFYAVAIVTMICGLVHSYCQQTFFYTEVLFIPAICLFMGKMLLYMHILSYNSRKTPPTLEK